MVSETDLQRAYDLSRQESRIYVMKQQGMKLGEIADYLNVSEQNIKNSMTRINAKIKERNHPMQFITIDQPNEHNTRRALALMALSILKMDVPESAFYQGKHTVVLFNMRPILGNSSLMWDVVLRKIDPLVHNEEQARVKAEQIYSAYLDAGGVRGEMGYGWVLQLFEKFCVKCDVF